MYCGLQTAIRSEAESRPTQPGTPSDDCSQRFFHSAQTKWIWLVFLIQITLLFVVGYRNRHFNDIDGASYARIAHYYATWKTDLMVSGYWGPLISWLMVPCLWLGITPFVAARIAAGVSAVVFQLGCISVLRAFELPARWTLLGMALSALASVSWSIICVSPDLLVSGIMCLAVSQMLHRDWLVYPGMAFRTGCIWGAAYLAKAIAFPVTFGVSIGFALLFIVIRAASRRQIIRQLALTFLGFSLIGGPWVLAISIKNQRPTFSESAGIAHALIGPPDVDRYHPIGRVLHRPEPGRIFGWENPTTLPYKHWSPFENSAYALHQLKHSAKNLWFIWWCLSDSDVLCLGLLAAFGGIFVTRKVWRERLLWEKWRWGVIPLSCMICIYVPVYAFEKRFYYGTFAIFFAMVAGALGWLGQKYSKSAVRIERIGFCLALLSFGFPAVARLPQAFAGIPSEPTRNAYILAQKLNAAGVAAPLLGTSGRFAIEWVGLFTEQPWFGPVPQGPAEAVRSTGAGLLVVRRTGQNAYEGEPYFENLDNVLFNSAAEANAFPVQVVRIRRQ